MTGILAKFVRQVACSPEKSQEWLTSCSHGRGQLRLLYQSAPRRARRQGLGCLPEWLGDKVDPIRKECIGQSPVVWLMLRVNFLTFQICHIKLRRIKPAVCPIIYNITGNLEWLIKEWKYFSFLRKKLASAKIHSNWLGMGMVQKVPTFKVIKTYLGSFKNPNLVRGWTMWGQPECQAEFLNSPCFIPIKKKSHRSVWFCWECCWP